MAPTAIVSEFLTIAHRNPTTLSLQAVFDELDVDGDGYIRRAELRQAFQRMGHQLTDADINAIYRHVDINNDGRINYAGEVQTRKMPFSFPFSLPPSSQSDKAAVLG